MKRPVLFSLLLFLMTFFAWGQKTFDHKQLIYKERAAALSKMLKQPLAETGNYDIKYVRLELQPSLYDRNISGAVTSYFTALEEMNQMEFDFTSTMQVDAVIYQNDSLNFTHEDDRLIIEIPSAISTGTLDSIQVIYNGNVLETGFGSYGIDTHNDYPIVWTLSEPYGARDWWPCKQDLTDKIDSIDIVLTYPAQVNDAEMFAVSNGTLSSETIQEYEGTDYKISTWKHRYPIAAYLVAFSITNYSKFSEDAGLEKTFPLDNYVFPENLAEVQEQSEYFVPVMNFYEETFGHYPFNDEKYAQVQFSWNGGMEHQTATFLVIYDRWLVAHELAHQWFGDAITCGSWHDIWINEGFATYSEALSVEYLDGQEAFDDWKVFSNNYITQAPDGAVYVQDTTSVSRIFDGRLSYQKGAMVLNMLRVQLGDSIFFDGLKNYVEQKSFQYAKTEDFKEIMEAQSGQNLDEFFNDWIYGEGYPTYEININYLDDYQYEVTINQTTSDESVSFFELLLPFTFTGNDGNILNLKLNNTTNNQQFIIDTGFEVSEVSFDPHHDIINKDSQINLNLGIAETNFENIQIFPNPVKDILQLKVPDNIQINEIKIYNSKAKMVKIINKPENFQIDLSHLNKDIYFIEINTQKYKYLKKIIKK